ncbi:MAG TPA: hypothetical protein PL155_02615 [Candidatus Omnitrophota bacterium]|nr:hypothetical protein [Candidatus Omnitrophota bacterium]HPD84621.1 hypothetical protein [Candidatus Omnitrophota bacterium]HRZ03479.1 hypothetical protein [Candidatus Omnitrophota bacterium]
MKKCPYCFEEVREPVAKCPHCAQFVIDDFIESDYRSIDKKRCIFCGKNILAEAKVCKHCRKWINTVDDAIKDME